VGQSAVGYDQKNRAIIDQKAGCGNPVFEGVVQTSAPGFAGASNTTAFRRLGASVKSLHTKVLKAMSFNLHKLEP
jgi:hypothetical protein